MSTSLSATLFGCLVGLGIASAASPAAAATSIPFEQYKENVCPHALCTTLYAFPPAGKSEQITNVGCQFRTSGPSSKIVSAEIDLVDSAGRVSMRDFLVPTLTSSVQLLGDIYAFNGPVLIYVPNGFRVSGSVSVSQNTGESIACLVTGTVNGP